MNQNENHKQYLAKNAKIKSNIFCLLGEEEALKSEFIKEVIKRYFGAASEIRIFHHDSSEDFQAFITYSRTASMFSNSRTAIFNEIEKCVQSTSNMQLLDELIENLPADTLLFFKTESNSLPASLKKIEMDTVMFWRPFENELKDQIRAEFAKNKIAVSPADISLILEYTGRDTAKINAALEKLQTFAAKESVNTEMIKYILNDEKEISIFDFIDNLFLKNHNSFINMQKLADADTHELVMLEFIKRELTKLEKYHGALKSTGNVSDALKSAGIYSKSNERFLKSAAIFSEEKIIQLFKELYITELSLKTGNTGKNLKNPMSNLILAIIKK